MRGEVQICSTICASMSCGQPAIPKTRPVKMPSDKGGEICLWQGTAWLCGHCLLVYFMTFLKHVVCRLAQNILRICSVVSCDNLDYEGTKGSQRDGHLEPKRWIHIAGQWRLYVCHGCRYHRWWIRWCPRQRAPCKSCCQRWVCNVFCTSAAYLEAQKTYDKNRTNQTIPDYTKLLQTFENMVQGPGATSLLWSIEK